MSYEFDTKNHIHKLDGMPLHGVTTVLSVIAKPALIQWAANMACDYMDGHTIADDNGKIVFTEEEFQNILKEARIAHRKKKEKAGDWGTILHEAIESWIKTKEEPKLEGEQKRVFEKFKEWVKDNRIEFLESEKHVWSKKLWVGGIVDVVFTMDGKKYIGDIKTASRIYNETFFQMGAYDLCLREMGEHQNVEGYVVINLKKSGEIDFKRADNMEINQRAFLAALELHKISLSLI